MSNSGVSALKEYDLRQVALNAFGGPEQLFAENATDVRPARDQVLVDVEAAGINYLDLTQRSGASKVHMIKLPVVLGLEGVGRIRAVGAEVDAAAAGLTVGSRVAWVDVPGSYASQVAIPVERAIPIPDSFTVSQSLLFQPLTAHYLVHEYRHIRPGDRVLVHAAAGGLGLLLVQWFKHLGAWVVGTTSNENKAVAAYAAGADAVVVYGNDYEFADQVKVLTNGQGVELAIDGLGQRTLLKTIEALARGGTAVAIGAASGPIPMVNPTALTHRGLRIAGGSVFSYVADPSELRRRAADVITAVETGWLKLDEASGYPLERVADAHRDIENRQTKGKIYLIP